MSLTEALRTGAPEAFGVLYDGYAERLYAYCHIMVGDEAADTVRDTFIAVSRHPGMAPADGALPVWLYALARAECVRRGALVRKPAATPSCDPLRRTLARLRPEHREALALSLTLEPAEVARVIGVAADTAEMLVRMSERRLEQAAASVLGSVYDESMLGALGDGKLPSLMTRGCELPCRLREKVLLSCSAAERTADGALLFDSDGMPIPLDGVFEAAEPVTHPFAKADAQSGVAPRRRSAPVGHPRSGKEPFLVRKRDGLVEIAGLAACVAAATGALTLWPSPHHGDGGSTMDGTGLLLHHGAPAGRSAQPVPSLGGADTPSGATSASSPSPTASKSGGGTTPPAASGQARSSARPSASAQPSAQPPARPTVPPAGGAGPAHPRPASPSSAPTSTPAPTPTPTPTSDGDSPAAEPSPSTTR